MQLLNKSEVRIEHPHRYATVAAGTTSTLFNLSVPESTILIIKALANNFFANTYFEFYIDGQLFENARIERSIGAINDPYKLPNKIVAKASVQVIAYNNDVAAHVMEFFIDGAYKQISNEE